VLTALNLAPGASVDAKARSEIGYALLNNPRACVAYCNDFGLAPNVETCEFDLSRSELKDVEPFRLLAGCLRGNRTLTHMSLSNLKMELITTLAHALRGNDKLQSLEIISASRGGGQSIVTLPVPELTGSKAGGSSKRVDMSKTCENGSLNRVTCGMVGALVGSNTTLECLDLTGTGVGTAIGQEGEGGHILFRPLCQDNVCPISDIVLDDVQLNDKAGGKLLSALVEGLGKGDHGYEKITSLSVARNELGKQFTTSLKQLLWSERAQCMIKKLNVSDNATLDGYELAVSLKRNDSLTSLDFRGVPGANTSDILIFIGSYLLQDDCQCRLGFISCDAFQITPGQTELSYTKEEAQDPDKPEKVLKADGKVEPVILLLAGVVKFNTTLTRLTLASGVNNEGAASVATAIKDNQTLEHLDVSGKNAITSGGIEKICAAVRVHPKLVAIKIEGTTSLPVAQLRGMSGAEAVLNVNHWNLGLLSGSAMGTLMKGNLLLGSLNLDHNQFGAKGIQAIIEGLAEAPVKSMHIKSTGLQGAEDDELLELSTSICANLGQLAELRMDENDLACDESCLAPICKMRNVRTLSIEKNRLSRMPAIIGTMLTLRHILLYSNQLIELPSSICLITGLEVLDVHKNMIGALPTNIGNLTSLKKLDVSENRVTELPFSICELSEEMTLSVGRNPLEKPAIEQARQGIGVIRRFFGYSKKDAADTSEPNVQPGNEVMHAGGQKTGPPARGAGTSSRHDWAGPGSLILLFNCHCCQFSFVEGSDTSSLLMESDDVSVVANFNMQVIGRFRSAKGPADTFAERLEFDNVWFPWSSQTVKPGETPTLLIQIKGKGRASASLIATPWLSYGCSIGAKLRTQHGYATVLTVREDDSVEVAYDTVHDGKSKGVDIRAGKHELFIDPRLDTVSRTSSPAYKVGQVLMLVHEKRLVDATVDHWFGPLNGSRHRVRFGGKGAAARSKKSAANKGLIVLDLNEENHARLLFSSVDKYEKARNLLLEVVCGEYTTVYDDVLGKSLRAADQRLYLRNRVVAKAESVAAPAEGEEEAADAAVKAEEETAKAEEEEENMNALTIVEELITPPDAAVGTPPTLFVRTRTHAEHDMLQAQTLFSLTSTLQSEAARLGAKSDRRQVPMPLSLTRLAEMMEDEMKRTNPRDMILKSIEASCPKKAAADTGEVLKQAVELRALVIVADLRSEQDLIVLKSEPVMEELLTHRLLILAPESIIDKFELPPTVQASCRFLEMHTWGCFMNDARLANYAAKQLLNLMRPKPGGVPSHYERVSVLHLAAAQIGKDTQLDLAELLKMESCTLRMLDLSNTQVESDKLATALASNKSLTSLDVRCVPKMSDSFEVMAGMLLNDEATSSLAYMRCDAFDVLEGESVLNLRERRLGAGAMRLLTGLLKNNREVQELDLSATNLQTDWVLYLIDVIAASPKSTINTLNIPYNPAIDEVGQRALAAAVEQRGLKLTLNF